MLNNKILAVVLSVIAVIVVVYQIFLREDDPVQPAQKAQFVNKSTGTTAPAPTPATSAAQNTETSDPATDPIENSNAMLIDIYSPELLKKVTPYIDNSRKEISGNYGEQIFGYKRKKEREPEKKEIQLPKLKLNGTIDLIRDKIQIAIINNRLYRKGEMVENAMVKRIGKYEVELTYNEETIVLKVDQGTYRGWIKKEIGGNL